jgi:hypothetical protein
MGWDVVVWGTIALGKKGEAAWLACTPDAKRWRDLRAPFRADDGEPLTVEAQLAAWKKLHARKGHILEVKVAGGKVTVAGILPKEELVERGRRYVATFRAAEDFGAKGALHFVHLGDDATYELALNGASPSTFGSGDPDLLGSRAMQQILARLAPPKPPKPPAPEVGLPELPTSIEELLRAFDEPTPKPKRFIGQFGAALRHRVTAVLAEKRSPVVGQHMLDVLLEDATMRIPAGSTKDCVAPTFAAHDAQHRVLAAISIIVATRYQPAWDRLAQLARKHPFLEIQRHAAWALFDLVDDATLGAAMGEDPKAFRAARSMNGRFMSLDWRGTTPKLLRYVKSLQSERDDAPRVRTVGRGARMR